MIHKHRELSDKILTLMLNTKLRYKITYDSTKKQLGYREEYWSGKETMLLQGRLQVTTGVNTK